MDGCMCEWRQTRAAEDAGTLHTVRKTTNLPDKGWKLTPVASPPFPPPHLLTALRPYPANLCQLFQFKTLLNGVCQAIVWFCVVQAGFCIVCPAAFRRNFVQAASMWHRWDQPVGQPDQQCHRDLPFWFHSQLQPENSKHRSSFLLQHKALCRHDCILKRFHQWLWWCQMSYSPQMFAYLQIYFSVKFPVIGRNLKSLSSFFDDTACGVC